MRRMCLSLLAERPHAFEQYWRVTFRQFERSEETEGDRQKFIWGGTVVRRQKCEGIITPPLLTLNMRGTASVKSVVKVNRYSKVKCAVCGLWCIRDDGFCLECKVQRCFF